MPRVNRVKKCRKAQGECGACGRKIEVGDGYLFWEFRYGGKRVRCLDCPPRRQDLTQSAFWATVYDIEDQLGDLSDDPNDLDDIVCAIQELSSECQDALDAVPEQLQESHLLQERIDETDAWMNEVEAVDQENTNWLEEAQACRYNGC